MRIIATFVAIAVLSTAAPVAWMREAAAQETIVIEGDTAVETADAPGACGCRDMQSPPWHGTVAGDACGPTCPPPTMFHANPCGQLWMKHTARQQGYLPPSCFPRLNGRLTYGTWPTPRPISLPRCPHCGMHIEAGM